MTLREILYALNLDTNVKMTVSRGDDILYTSLDDEDNYYMNERVEWFTWHVTIGMLEVHLEA